MTPGRTCPYGDPTCPCQDGDPCHYEPFEDTPAITPPGVAQALDELDCLTECRCDPAWTERDLHAPDCASDYREDVDTLRAALSALARMGS